MEDSVLKERLELALERGGLEGAALAQGKRGGPAKQHVCMKSLKHYIHIFHILHMSCVTA